MSYSCLIKASETGEIGNEDQVKTLASEICRKKMTAPSDDNRSGFAIAYAAVAISGGLVGFLVAWIFR
jgi:hypothetical protein